jgi:hypothetical protein
MIETFQSSNFLVQFESAEYTSNELGIIRPRAQALPNGFEADYAKLCGWFGVAVGAGLGPANRVIVTLTKKIRGASNTGYSTSNPKMTVNAVIGGSDDSVLSLFVAEMIEILMSYKGKWNAADSGGEGLSRVAAQVLHPQSGSGFAKGWLAVDPTTDSTSAVADSEFRKDWVSKNFTGGPLKAGGSVRGDDDSYSYGCAMLFIYYLKSQLGYSMPQIVQNAGATLSDTYRNLTGRADGWTSFINLVNSHYPPGLPYNPATDSVFPVPELSSFPAPNQITCGYSNSTPIFIDRAAPAEVNIRLSSEDPKLVIVPSAVTIPVGSVATSISIQTAPLPVPFAPKIVKVNATYAGKTLTMSVDVVQPALASVVLSPDTVVCGNGSTGTVVLNAPSLLGGVDVDLTCSVPGFATVPAKVKIPQNATTETFPITTPDIEVPFKTAHPAIWASYAGSSATAALTVKPKVIAGILKTLSLFPTTVTGGNSSRATITLEEPVSTDTLVGLAVVDSGSVLLPGDSDSSDIASAPPSVIIPAGETSAVFNVKTTKLPLRTRRSVTVIAAAEVNKYAMLTITG